jgi:proteasome-associated ATPase
VTRSTRGEAEIPLLLNQLKSVGPNAPSAEQKIQLLNLIRNYSRDAGAQLDRFFIEELNRCHGSLAEAKENQVKFKEILDRLTAPPWYPAIFLGMGYTARGDTAMVLHGNTRRVVQVADEVDPELIAAGDEVLLSNELNVILDVSPYRFIQCGETATFDRYTADRRVVLKTRDEEVIVDSAGALGDAEMTSGDQVRWDRSAWMAFEKIDRSTGASLFLEETPAETFDQIGGLERQIERLQRSIHLHLNHRETVRKYRLKPNGSTLLVGPPGTGKTMMARALANWLAQISASGRSHFMNIKPSQLHSMWYSQSEANYREVFRVAREAGEKNPEVPVVMFFDEVDAIGASRGNSLMRVDDRVLTAFMTELNGLESRGNILVVCATNRLDALDPALVRAGRLGDNVIQVPRPKLRAAREIFSKHLHSDIPYTGEGQSEQAARQEIIERAVSRIYSPNGDNDLATITFRDGKRRAVKAADLMSGAGLAKIALSAIERACVREVEGGQPGVCVEDMLSAISEELEFASSVLIPANCHKHLTDLPQDVDVVRVDAVQRKVSSPHRYLSVA